MMDEEFKRSDLVRLMSGGPVMTVNRELPNGYYEVIWFGKEDCHTHDFHGDILVRAVPDEGQV